MSSRDGVVMYEMEKERRAEMLAEFGPVSYRRQTRELPGFRLGQLPAAAKVALVLSSVTAAVVWVANVL